jgi:hypothetical protein
MCHRADVNSQVLAVNEACGVAKTVCLCWYSFRTLVSLL